MRRHIFPIIAVLLAACAATGDNDSSGDPIDGGSSSSNPPSTTPGPEGGPAHPGEGGVATGSMCTLGSAANCGTCGVACSGMSDTKTKVICSDATTAGHCDIECLGESYDVNGKIDDGCEASDPIIQDSAGTAVAVTLPDSVSTDGGVTVNPLNILGLLYGDSRMHDAAPALRPLGRDDWYKITAVGTGEQDTGMIACLSIANFPTDDIFEVCISDDGQVTFDPAACKTVSGGQSGQCVTPPKNTDAGTYAVKVRKVSGSNTLFGYALYVKH